MGLIARARAAARRREIGHALYVSLVERARHVAFYRDHGVPDTLDGRFDMIVLHVVLAARRLGRIGPDGAALAQAVVDTMFKDMDRSLREMGVGDLGVGRRVKAMARAYHGRRDAYDAALAAGDDVLAATLARNVFAVTSVPAQALALAAYVRRVEADLAQILDGEALAGRLDVTAPPDPAGG